MSNKLLEKYLLQWKRSKCRDHPNTSTRKSDHTHNNNNNKKNQYILRFTQNLKYKFS